MVVSSIFDKDSDTNLRVDLAENSKLDAFYYSQFWISRIYGDQRDSFYLGKIWLIIAPNERKQTGG